jgi:hypothetical protein
LKAFGLVLLVSIRGLLLGTLCLGACGVAWAQQTLPPASRTVYKCQQDGKTVYSDSPCLGAQRLDVEPTRGMDKSSGRSRVGADVQRERINEAVATAVRPITGMSADQFEVARRRVSLPAAQQRACKQLDQAIPSAEAEERAAPPGPSLAAAQRKLYDLRVAYRNGRC